MYPFEDSSPTSESATASEQGSAPGTRRAKVTVKSASYQGSASDWDSEGQGYGAIRPKIKNTSQALLHQWMNKLVEFYHFEIDDVVPGYCEAPVSDPVAFREAADEAVEEALRELDDDFASVKGSVPLYHLVDTAHRNLFRSAYPCKIIYSQIPLLRVRGFNSDSLSTSFELITNDVSVALPSEFDRILGPPGPGTENKPPFLDSESVRWQIDGGMAPLDALHKIVRDALEPQFTITELVHRDFHQR